MNPKWSRSGYPGQRQPLRVMDQTPQLQKMMYSKLMETFFACGIKDRLGIRLSNMFAPYDLDFVNDIKFDPCFNLLRSLSCADPLRILKIWANGWATSYRMRDPICFPCLFGCDRKDSMTHDVMCPILFSLLSQSRPETQACPLKRIGLVDPSRESLLTLACSFAGHHAVRNNYRLEHTF